jgi:hypothetical protein
MEERMNTGSKLGYDPVAAYTVRLALRRHFFRGEELTHATLIDILQEARSNLGLSEYQGGAASDFIQKKIVKGYDNALRKTIGQGWIEKAGAGRYIVKVAWPRVWRFLFAPSHREVLDVAWRGTVPKAVKSLFVRFSTDNPSYPSIDLKVFSSIETGSIDPVAIGEFLDEYMRYSTPLRGDPADGIDDAALYFQQQTRKPMLYIYFCKDQEGRPAVYMGQTGEPRIRFLGHMKRNPAHVILLFPAPHEGEMNDSDLNAAESLWISYYDEICNNVNTKLGSDSLPQTLSDLRRASSFVTAAAAAVWHLGRMQEEFRLPFRPRLASALKRSGDGYYRQKDQGV